MDIVAKAHLNLLVRLASSDKEICHQEKKLIREVAYSYGFDTLLLTRLFNAPEPIESLSALSDNKKFEFLYTGTALILCDNKVHDSELILFRDIAHKLGFVIKVVDYMCENFSTMSHAQLKEAVFTRFK